MRMESPSPAAAEAGAEGEPSPEAPLAVGEVGCARTPRGSARQEPASGSSGTSGADASPRAPAVLSPAPRHRAARGRVPAAPRAQTHLVLELPVPLRAGNPSGLGSRWSPSAAFAAQRPVMPERPGTRRWGAARAAPNMPSCCFSPSLPCHVGAGNVWAGLAAARAWLEGLRGVLVPFWDFSSQSR